MIVYRYFVHAHGKFRGTKQEFGVFKVKEVPAWVDYDGGGQRVHLFVSLKVAQAVADGLNAEGCPCAKVGRIEIYMGVGAKGE
jgi:hypothetical protein